jgi:UDP-glucose-4-epimerase GalE
VSVLVTGGAGYIGAHTVRALRRAGRDVVVLDSLEHGDASRVSEVPLVVGDVADRALVARTCRERGVTSVVHFAAHKAVGESMHQPIRYWRNNVGGSIRLLEGLRDAGVATVVFSSSAAVYGTPARVPVAEDAPCRPESVYAETKHCVERILVQLGAEGVRAVNLRYFNAAGASADATIGEDWATSQNLVPRVMRALLEPDAPLELFGDDYPTPDGTCVRDYVHVDDLAEAHVRALEHLERGGATLTCNVGTGRGTSVREVLAAAAAAAGRPVPHRVAPRRAGDPVAVWADVSLARTVLGWTATRELAEILGSAWRWHSRGR